MAFPAPIDVVLSAVVLAVGVPVVYLLSRAFRLHTATIAIALPKKEAMRASVLVVVLFAFVFSWRTLVYVFAHGSGVAADLPTPIVDSTIVLWLSAAEGISLLILAVAMKITRQTLGSIGISRINIGKMVAFGLTISAIYVAITGLYAVLGGGGFAGFSSSLAYGFILSAAAGFAEETIWRGYVQTRFVAFAGRTRGVLITSLLFGVLWHFPRAYYFEASQMVLPALAWTVSRVFLGVLLGYMMVRSQNVVASSIFHTGLDWTTVLWR